MKASVVGAGSWGTALAMLLARNGHDIRLIARDEATAQELRQDRENRQYLPGFAFPSGLQVVSTQQAALEDDEFRVLAVPSSAVDDVLPLLQGSPIAVVATKGLHAPSGEVMSDMLEAALPGTHITALSGPNLAIEIARGIPTAAVSAGPLEAATRIRDAFLGPTFRVYVSDDLRGVELAGALKNVMAIGAGMSDGLGYGDNTKGAFLARGLHEMTRLGLAMGAQMPTFLGLAGVGDLFATASSTLSRNYRVGYGMGQGQSLEAVLETIGQVAEGVPTCTAAVRLATQHGVEVPIMTMLQAVLTGHLDPREGVVRLMERRTLRETGD